MKIGPDMGLGLKTHHAKFFRKNFGGIFEFEAVLDRFLPNFSKLLTAF